MDNMNGLLALRETKSQRDNDTAIEVIRRHVASFLKHLSFVDFDVPGLAREFNLNNQQMREGMIFIDKKCCRSPGITLLNSAAEQFIYSSGAVFM